MIIGCKAEIASMGSLRSAKRDSESRRHIAVVEIDVCANDDPVL